MTLRVFLATGAGLAETLRPYIATAAPEARVWLPQCSQTKPAYDAVVALPTDVAPPAAIAGTVMYEANEIVGKAGAQDGVGLLAFLTPRPELSRAELMRQWDEHIPLANAAHYKATSYRQYRFERALSADAPNFAGFAILHFSSEDALKTGLYRDDRDIEMIRTDVAEFAAGAVTMQVTEFKRL